MSVPEPSFTADGPVRVDQANLLMVVGLGSEITELKPDEGTGIATMLYVPRLDPDGGGVALLPAADTRIAYDTNPPSSAIDLYGNKVPVVVPIGPAPTPGEAQTIQGWGILTILGNSFIGVTDKTARGDLTWLWLGKGGSDTLNSGITSWEDLISKMEAAKPPGGYSALVISGHGALNGGVQASGRDLDLANLSAAQIARLKALLKDGAPLILFACYQGNTRDGQELANRLGHPVIGNMGQVGLGDTGYGDWIRYNPK